MTSVQIKSNPVDYIIEAGHVRQAILRPPSVAKTIQQTMGSRPYIPETLHVKPERQRTDRTVADNMDREAASDAPHFDHPI